MRLLVTDTAAQSPRQATAWIIMALGRNMRKPSIKLMADYQCSPLWHADGIEVGNIDPAEIGVSEALRRDMEEWVGVYGSHLDLGDPSSCSWTEAEEKEFDQVGLALWGRLISEIGNRFSISYHGINIRKNEA